jgi:hypothetical protein
MKGAFFWIARLTGGQTGHETIRTELTFCRYSDTSTGIR